MKKHHDHDGGFIAFVSLFLLALGIALGSVAWNAWKYDNWRCGFQPHLCRPLFEKGEVSK